MHFCLARLRPGIVTVLCLLVILMVGGCNPLEFIGSSLTFNIYIPLGSLTGGSVEQMPSGGTNNNDLLPTHGGVPNQPPVGGFPIDPVPGTPGTTQGGV